MAQTKEPGGLDCYTRAAFRHQQRAFPGILAARDTAPQTRLNELNKTAKEGPLISTAALTALYFVRLETAQVIRGRSLAAT